MSSDDASSNTQTNWRLPASEIEAVVVDGIANFLEHRVRLSASLDLDADNIEAMLSRAWKLAYQFTDAAGPEQRRSILSWVERIEVQQNRVNIELRLDTLKNELLDNAVNSDVST